MLYVITLVVMSFGLWTYRSRRNLSWFSFLVFSLIVVIPSYPVYRALHNGMGFGSYFVAVLTYQLMLLIGVAVSPSGLDWNNQVAFRRWHVVEISISLLVLLCAMLYIYIASSSYEGGYPLLEIILRGDNPLSFRLYYWNEVLVHMPMASLLRFMAKTGTLYIGLRLLSTGHKKLSLLVLLMALLTYLTEGTKGSLIAWGFPVLFFWVISRKAKASLLIVLSIILIVGTIGLGLLEANFDFRTALWDKILGRIFVVPVNVSMFHYSFFRDHHLYGATNGIVMNLRGGLAAVLQSPALNYDNYITRETALIMTGQKVIYGHMNAPAFIYGWVDFGLIGVMIIGILTAGSIFLLDKLVKQKRVSSAFTAVLLYSIVSMITSHNYWDSFFDAEGISFLLILDIFLGRDNKGPNLTMIGISFLGVGYYLLSFIVSRLV